MNTQWQKWHVTQLTPEAADAHTRRAHSIGPNVTLGWTPCNYLVTYGSISQWACHTEEEFQSWLQRNSFTEPQWTPWHNGIRSAFLDKKED
jgi:hypothetical protein